MSDTAANAAGKSSLEVVHKVEGALRLAGSGDDTRGGPARNARRYTAVCQLPAIHSIQTSGGDPRCTTHAAALHGRLAPAFRAAHGASVTAARSVLHRQPAAPAAVETVIACSSPLRLTAPSIYNPAYTG